MDYKLACVSFDGDFVIDHVGSVDDCRNASENMGSKWYFYPWHMVLTEKNYIKECYGSLVNMETGDPIMGMYFNGKKLSTLRKQFKTAYDYAKDNDLTLDLLSFEDLVFDLMTF